jgi:nucleoid DNA-binding protein
LWPVLLKKSGTLSTTRTTGMSAPAPTGAERAFVGQALIDAVGQSRRFRYVRCLVGYPDTDIAAGDGLSCWRAFDEQSSGRCPRTRCHSWTPDKPKRTSPHFASPVVLRASSAGKLCGNSPAFVEQSRPNRLYFDLEVIRKGASMAQMSKSQLIQTIAEQHSGNLTRKDVKGVIESLASTAYKELKKTGAFVLPGFAKFVVIKKPATKARKGINPFTKELTTFKAKPARKLVRARPVKAIKDAV